MFCLKSVPTDSGATLPFIQSVLRYFSSGVKRPQHEAGHFRPSVAEVKNWSRDTSTSPYAFVACMGTTLPMQSMLRSNELFTKMNNSSGSSSSSSSSSSNIRKRTNVCARKVRFIMSAQKSLLT
jgi:hypothetical protein